MSALRKPDHLTAAYKMAYLKSRAPHMTGDQFKLEFMLVDHAGVQGCFPALPTLAREMSVSKTKVRRLRDQLAVQGEIGFVSGTGHDSTQYSIPGLFAHTAALQQKKASRVPKPTSGGAAQTGTEPSNPSLNQKGDGPPDLKVVPIGGWMALVAQASDKMRNHWLPGVELVSQGPDGILLKSAASMYADRIRQELEQGGELYAIAVSLGIDPEKVKIEAPSRGAAPVRPATLFPTPHGMEEAAQRLEERSDGPIEPMPAALPPNVTSLDAYRSCKTHLEKCNEQDDDDRPG